MTTEGPKADAPGANGISARIPPEVTAALNDSQLAALKAAIDEPRPWRKQPVDIRLTFPFFARRVFITLIAGTDKRNPVRRKQDRQQHPLRTASNILFLGAAVIALYAIAGAIALLIAAAVRGG